MRSAAVLLFLALPLCGAPDAAGYFEIGVDYLRKGFYGHARRAFAESLLQAPGEAVPIAFLGVAATAEGYEPRVCARLFRRAYDRLPKGKSLKLDLRSLLPARGLPALLRRYEQRIEKAKGAARRDVLTVLAFLQVHDGTPKEAPALDRLRRDHPKDPYVKALGGG